MMYHFYKVYGDSAYEERQLNSYKNETHSITTQINTLITFSPGFFRNELETGLSILGIEEGGSPLWSDLIALDAFVINPLVDLLYEYVKVDRIGAKFAAEEMIEVLNARESCEDFPERQIELLKSVTGIKL